MNEFDIFAAFNLDGDEEESQGVAKKNKPKKEKTDKKKNEKKGSKKSTKTYELPIKLCGGHLQYVFIDEDESVSTWSEDALKEAIKKQYRELAGFHFNISTLTVEEKESDIATYIKLDVLYREFSDSDKLEFPLDIVAGETSMWLDTPVSLDEARELWVKEYPEFQGCKFQYDEKQKILMPYMEGNAPRGKSYSLPVSVGYLQIKEEYQAEDFETEEVTEDAIREKYSKKYPEFCNCEFAYHEEQNLLFPIMKTTNTKGKKSDKISLPVPIRAGGFSMTVQPEDVGGAKEATLEEIRKVLESVYPEYAKERTVMLYDEKHFIVPILKSSEKGLEIHSTMPSWHHEIMRDECGNRWRVERRPFGCFMLNLTDGKMRFELLSPKIPSGTLLRTLRLFESDPQLEYAVQIFYDAKEQRYELFVPEQERSSAAVFFERSPRMEQEKTLMMDIHSHGMYPAFFSAQDDADEKGVRLYMVVGNLDLEEHSYMLRAGLAGNFLEIPISEVFDT